MQFEYRKYANNNRGYYCFQPPFLFWGQLQLEGGYNYKIEILGYADMLSNGFLFTD